MAMSRSPAGVKPFYGSDVIYFTTRHRAYVRYLSQPDSASLWLFGPALSGSPLRSLSFAEEFCSCRAAIVSLLDHGGNRMGNRKDTNDGSTYIGRGGPQITGRDGYAEVGKRCKLDLFGNPNLPSAPENQPAILAAFWTWKNLNRLLIRAIASAVSKHGMVEQTVLLIARLG